MFQSNLSCLFRKKTNKVEPQQNPQQIVNIKVWENKQNIKTVTTKLPGKSNLYKTN
jgi:hypothetical protein